MDSPRIGVDVTSALAQGGGIGRYTRELMRAIAESDSRYLFKLFSARVPEALPIPDPLPVRKGTISHRLAPISEKWLYRLWYRLRLPLPVQLFTGHLDLYHSPDFVLPPTSGDIPTLLTVHDLSFVHYPDTFPSALVNYLNEVVPWSVKRATHIVADSYATKNDLIDLWQVAEEKITVLYSGVSREYRPVEDDSQIQHVRLATGLARRPYILSVGTVQPRKNYQMLIRAYAAIAPEFPHDLAIAGGKGWLEEEMTAEAARHNVADRVHFLGFVADEYLPALYSGASLFTFPSLYEGFGLPVLEAMACGVPSLISNSSSLPEVGGEAVMQISPVLPEAWSAGMAMVLSDPQKAAAMRLAGFAQAQRFSWERSAEELLAVYDTLLDNSPSSRHNYQMKET